MSRILEIEGKTIDEAIFAGLEQMGLSFDEVDIDILQESNKGFLAIAKIAHLLLSRKLKMRWKKKSSCTTQLD